MDSDQLGLFDLGSPSLVGDGYEFEFYETPSSFVHQLYREMQRRVIDVRGLVLEPFAGSCAISRAWPGTVEWRLVDLDPRWPRLRPMVTLGDARDASIYEGVDWVITNPAFTVAYDCLELALAHARVGVALYVRGSFMEPTQERRALFVKHPPSGILWLPRFAHRRSKTTGEWSTDSMTCCWLVWLTGGASDLAQTWVAWPDDQCYTDVARETAPYRARMDRLVVELCGALAEENG